MLPRWRAVLPAAVLVLGACAAEPPAEESLPLPPPPPPRLQAQRAALPPARNGPEAEAPAAAEAPGEVPPGVTPAAAAAPPPAWRVARDGTIGCADPASLRLVRQGAETTPRLLAEARAAGGCRTTFRINEWALEMQEADIVRLRLVNGPAMSLWFARADVVAP